MSTKHTLDNGSTITMLLPDGGATIDGEHPQVTLSPGVVAALSAPALAKAASDLACMKVERDGAIERGKLVLKHYQRAQDKLGEPAPRVSELPEGARWDGDTVVLSDGRRVERAPGSMPEHFRVVSPLGFSQLCWIDLAMARDGEAASEPDLSNCGECDKPTRFGTQQTCMECGAMRLVDAPSQWLVDLEKLAPGRGHIGPWVLTVVKRAVKLDSDLAAAEERIREFEAAGEKRAISVERDREARAEGWLSAEGRDYARRLNQEQNAHIDTREALEEAVRERDAALERIHELEEAMAKSAIAPGPIAFLIPEDAQVGDRCRPDRHGMGTVKKIEDGQMVIYLDSGGEVHTDLASLPTNRTLPRNSRESLVAATKLAKVEGERDAVMVELEAADKRIRELVPDVQNAVGPEAVDEVLGADDDWRPIGEVFPDASEDLEREVEKAAAYRPGLFTVERLRQEYDAGWAAALLQARATLGLLGKKDTDGQ